MVPGFFSGGRKWLGGVLIVFVMTAILFAAGMYLSRTATEVTTLKIGDNAYAVRVVTSSEDRRQGLSGTERLNQNEGMLFIFPENERWGIWMKDMNYPIDIVWLDEAKTVVDISENATPASYPDTTFKPKQPARYVIELASGSISEDSISIGDRATFSVMAEKERG